MIISLLLAAGALLAAVMVAFRPGWLATWSDRLYLKP